jgi:hypothetical protein
MSTEKSGIICCDYQDFFNLCDGKSMEYTPTIFPSFANLYEFLLGEEEKVEMMKTNNKKYNQKNIYL